MMWILNFSYTGSDGKLADHDISTASVGLCYVGANPWTYQPFKTPAHGGIGFNVLRPDGHVFFLQKDRIERQSACTNNPYAKSRMCNGDY